MKYTMWSPEDHRVCHPALPLLVVSLVCIAASHMFNPRRFSPRGDGEVTSEPTVVESWSSCSHCPGVHVLCLCAAHSITIRALID